MVLSDLSLWREASGSSQAGYIALAALVGVVGLGGFEALGANMSEPIAEQTASNAVAVGARYDAALDEAGNDPRLRDGVALGDPHQAPPINDSSFGGSDDEQEGTPVGDAVNWILEGVIDAAEAAEEAEAAANEPSEMDKLVGDIVGDALENLLLPEKGPDHLTENLADPSPGLGERISQWWSDSWNDSWEETSARLSAFASLVALASPTHAFSLVFAFVGDSAMAVGDLISGRVQLSAPSTWFPGVRGFFDNMAKMAAETGERLMENYRGEDSPWGPSIFHKLGQRLATLDDHLVATALVRGPDHLTRDLPSAGLDQFGEPLTPWQGGQLAADLGGDWFVDSSVEASVAETLANIDFSKRDIIIHISSEPDRHMPEPVASAISPNWGAEHSLVNMTWTDDPNAFVHIPTGVETLRGVLEGIRELREDGQRVWVIGPSKGSWVAGETFALYPDLLNEVEGVALMRHPALAHTHYDEAAGAKIREYNHPHDAVSHPISPGSALRAIEAYNAASVFSVQSLFDRNSLSAFGDLLTLNPQIAALLAVGEIVGRLPSTPVWGETYNPHNHLPDVDDVVADFLEMADATERSVDQLGVD